MTATRRAGARRVGKVRVVLCDDSELARGALLLLLRTEESVEVVGEASTIKALETLLPNSRPDVILLDLNLPDARGREGVDRLRSASVSTPIILVSADTSVEAVAAKAGVPYYVKAYADIDQLVELVHAAADQSDA